MRQSSQQYYPVIIQGGNKLSNHQLRNKETKGVYSKILAIKRNGALTPATAQMNLENVMLSGRR